MQPLKGIPVVTLEYAIAAPFATRQLADLGPTLLPPGSWDDGEPRLDAVSALGQHTDAILTELGLDAAAITALRAEQAI